MVFYENICLALEIMKYHSNSPIMSNTYVECGLVPQLRSGDAVYQSRVVQFLGISLSNSCIQLGTRSKRYVN